MRQLELVDEWLASLDRDDLHGPHLILAHHPSPVSSKIQSYRSRGYAFRIIKSNRVSEGGGREDRV